MALGTFVCRTCKTEQSTTFRHCASETCPWCSSCYARVRAAVRRAKGQS